MPFKVEGAGGVEPYFQGENKTSKSENTEQKVDHVAPGSISHAKEEPGSETKDHKVTRTLSDKENASPEEQVSTTKSPSEQVIATKTPPKKNDTKHGPTKKAIALEARLFEASRRVLGMEGHPTFVRMDTKVNEVYQVFIPGVEKPVAYIKHSPTKDPSTNIVEKLVWDVAGKLGLEDFFVPTKLINIPTQNRSKLIGSVQLAQEGQSLKQLRMSLEEEEEPSSSPLNMDNFIQSAVVAQVMGMYDARLENIIVDPKGNLKFFDNARSLPNGNGFLICRTNEKGLVNASFRSGLLCFPESHAPLTKQQLKLLEMTIVEIEKRLPSAKAYFTSNHVQKEIGRLPAGWMNERSIDALEKRVAAIKEALKEGKIHCLNDIAVLTNPAFKFEAAIQAAVHFPFIPEDCADLDPDSIHLLQELTAEAVGFVSIEEAFDQCVETGIDPKFIYELCENPDLSYDQIIHAIAAQKYKVAIGEVAADPEVLKQHADDLKKLVREQATIDFKDTSAESIAFASHTLIEESLKAEGFEIISEDALDSIESLSPGHVVITQSNETPPQLTLYHHDKDSIQKYQLNYCSHPGKIVLVGNDGPQLPMTAAELNTRFNPDLRSI